MNELVSRKAAIAAERKKMMDELGNADESRVNEIETRQKELDLEERKLDMQIADLKNAVPDPEENYLDQRGASDTEKRAAAFAATGKTEMRAVLSTGSIAKPQNVGTEINGLAEAESTIVDDVKAIPISGAGAWTEPYRAKDAVAKDVVDGAELASTSNAEFGTVTINPAEWSVIDEISNQVQKMTPANYLAAVTDSALIGLRVEAEHKIIVAIKASTLKGSLVAALDQDYLRSVALGFKSIPGKGAAKLYLCQADLLTLGKIRGTNEKKALYEITFNPGTQRSGIITEGGLAVPFSITDELTAGTQIYGQPKTVSMPMWDNYVIETNGGGEYFKKNLIGVRGVQTANADLAAYKGMTVITNSAS